MKTITISGRLSMKTMTNTLLGAVLCLLVICAAAELSAYAQSNIAAWGRNTYGEVSGVPSGTFIAANAGGAHSVALRTDGTDAARGNDGYGVVSGPPAGGDSRPGQSWSVALRTEAAATVCQ